MSLNSVRERIQNWHNVVARIAPCQTQFAQFFMPSVRYKRAKQKQHTLDAHLALLNFCEVSEYQKWCAKNGFSRRTDKSARERSEEYFRRFEGESKRPSSDYVDPLSGKTYQEVNELILSGHWKGQPAHDERQRQLRDAVDLLTTNQTVPGHRRGRLAAFRDLHAALKRTKLLTEFRTRHGQCSHANSLAKIAIHYRSWHRPLGEWKAKSKNPQRLLMSLLDHLFVVHSVPKFAYESWRLPESPAADRDQQIFVHLAKGHSIRKFAGLPFQYGKRMSHYFLQAPETCTITQAIRWGQLRSLGVTENHAEAIIASYLGEYFDHDQFWLTFFRWLAKYPMLDQYELGPLIDFLGRQKLGIVRPAAPRVLAEQPGLSMQGRTPETLLRAMNRWHRQINQRGRYVAKATWGASGILGFKYEEGVHNKVTWTIHELLTSQELFDEGTRMGHCVGSYSRSCASGVTTIWSLRKTTAGGEERCLTVEVRPSVRQICQARGKRNRMPTDQELRILRLWTQKANLGLRERLI